MTRCVRNFVCIADPLPKIEKAARTRGPRKKLFSLFGSAYGRFLSGFRHSMSFILPSERKEEICIQDLIFHFNYNARQQHDTFYLFILMYTIHACHHI